MIAPYSVIMILPPPLTPKHLKIVLRQMKTFVERQANTIDKINTAAS